MKYTLKNNERKPFENTTSDRAFEVYTYDQTI